MIFRWFFVLVLNIILLSNAYAAQCLDIFPGSTNDDLLNKNLTFINLPPFTGADGYLANPQSLSLGDGQYLSNASKQTITVGNTPINESTSRLYLAGGASWNNAKINVGGNPEDLIIIANGSLAISGGQTEINAIIYSRGGISISGNVTINGAVAAEGAISATPSASINYDQNAIENADFNGMCDNAPVPAIPIANYRLDECEYTGAAFEVIDQTGTYPANTFSSLATDSNGQIERFADLSDEGHHIETSIPVPTNFSVSTWFKKPTSTSDSRYFVLGAMQSGGDLFYVDRNNGWRWAVYDGSGATSGTYSFASLDNTWHHMALVYSAGQTLLYIDGILEDSISRAPSGTLRYIGTSFDGVNGNNPQGFRAPLDEFLVYDVSLTAADISTIYNNQLAKNNYDGSARAVVNCSPFLAFYQFEQTDFSGQINDTSGLDNHATNIFGGLSTPDGKYCRGFESESWNDYNGITDAFRAGVDLDDDVGLRGTISFWFNSSINWNQGSERVLFDASVGDTASDKYFVLEIQQDGRLKFAFEDSSDADFTVVESSTNSRTANTWYYVTVTWDYIANDFAIYLDGNLQIQQTRNTNGALGELQQIVFGDNSSNYTQAGNSPVASPYSSRGNYDEVRIYKKVLTQNEIQTDMNEDNGCLGAIIAEWRMDEVNWSGTASEVVDEINNLHGTAFNGTITENSDPAKVGNPGTCRYGVFDGINDYVEIADNPLLDLPIALSVSTWIYPQSLPSSGLMSIVSKDENYEFHLTPQGEINWWWDKNSFTTSGASISANNWYHITITYKDGQQIIYVNAVDRASRTYTGELNVNNDPFQIGQDQGFAGRYFHGRIDEVRVYDYALSASEVMTVFNDTHPCDSYVDHFEIDTLDGVGLTCQADNITIKACADVSCSAVYPDPVDVVLSINNTAYKTVTVSGASGTSTSYSYTTLGNAALSLDQSYQCTNTPSTTPCNVDFKDSGFIFSNIPTQISGKPSNILPDSAALSLQAVKTDTGTGACVGIFPNGGDIPVNLSYTCNSGTCTKNLALTNNNNTYTINTSASSRVLRFGADSTAFFDINYPDAGRLILNAQKTIEVEDSDGNKVSKDFTGLSAPFVERPFGFFINALDNKKAEDASGDAYKKAGENFTIELSAVTWESADDSNNDGIPDIGADLSGNIITTNFGNEANSEKDTAVIDHGLVAPNPGILGGLTTNPFIFTNGVASNANIAYSEVGIINLTANLSDNSYLGTSDVQGNEPFVGRFIPDHFVLIPSHGELKGYCDNVMTPVEMTFTYSGQMNSASPGKGAIRYRLPPSFTITAKSVNAVNTTVNYTGSYMKLVENSITRKKVVVGGSPFFAPVVDGSQDGTQGVKLALTSNLSDITTADLQANEALGVVNYIYKSDDNFVYRHELNAEINPFTSDINLPIVSIIDTDSVMAKDADGDFDNDGDPSNALDSVLTLEPIGAEIRFGRAYLENSYGPETSSLPQVLSVEYYDSGKYLLSNDDICSLYHTDKISFGTINEVSLDTDDIVLKTGKFNDLVDFPDGLTRQMVLPPAGKDNQGRVEVIYTIYDWLQYDWAYDNEGIDGLFNDNPQSIATFGLFRGNDRIIYQREIQR